jgi:hypothetical protein
MGWDEILTWNNLFPGVDKIITMAQIPFLGIAFVMLVAHVYGSIGNTAASRGLDLNEWIRPFLMAAVASVCIANIGKFTTIGIQAGDELAAKVSESVGGKSVQDTMTMIWERADLALPKEQALVGSRIGPDPTKMSKDAYKQAVLKKLGEDIPGISSAALSEAIKKAGDEWDSVNPNGEKSRLDKFAEAFGGSNYFGFGLLADLPELFRQCVLFLMKWLCLAFVYVALCFGVVVMKIVMLAQMVIVKFGAIMLPVFIAGLLTGYFRSQSINYIMSILGAMLWPVGWAMANIGTYALATACFTFMTTSRGLSSPPSTGGAVIDAGAAVSGYFGSIVVSLLFCLILVSWIIVTMLGFPFLIQKAVTSGANFAQSAIAGAGKMALNTAGAAMVMEGMGASAAAAMKGRGEPSGDKVGSPSDTNNVSDSKALAKLGGFGDSVGGSSRGGGGGGGGGGAGQRVASARRATRTTTDADGKTTTETEEEMTFAMDSEGDSKGQSPGSDSKKDGKGQSPGSGGSGGGRGFAGALAQAATNINPLTALGRTMQNLAASDGSPESMYRVPDTGIDETRRAIAESMQAMRNNHRNPPKA